MLRLKKRTCLMAMFVILLSVSFVYLQAPSVSYVKASRATGSDNCWARDASYESGGFIALGRTATLSDTYESLRALRESSSFFNHRFHKEAEKTLLSEQQEAWRAYVAEYRRSTTDGGKNSKITSPNHLKDWRDALRPAYFS